jgi:hypothetical protein
MSTTDPHKTSYDAQCTTYTMTGSLPNPTLQCASCQSGFTLAKVDVTVSTGPTVVTPIFDCLDNTAVVTSAETIPFCTYYTLDGALSTNRYYCKDDSCETGSTKIVMVDTTTPLKYGCTKLQTFPYAVFRRCNAY